MWGYHYFRKHPYGSRFSLLQLQFDEPTKTRCVITKRTKMRQPFGIGLFPCIFTEYSAFYYIHTRYIYTLFRCSIMIHHHLIRSTYNFGTSPSTTRSDLWKKLGGGFPQNIVGIFTPILGVSWSNLTFAYKWCFGNDWHWIHPILGGGSKYFVFSSLFGEIDPIWLLFFRWVESNHQLVYWSTHSCR